MISSVSPIYQLYHSLLSNSQQSLLDITFSASYSPDGKNHVYRLLELWAEMTESSAPEVP